MHGLFGERRAPRLVAYLHGSVAFACRSPLSELPLDGGEGHGEGLQPHLLLQQLYQLLRQILQGGVCTTKRRGIKTRAERRRRGERPADASRFPRLLLTSLDERPLLAPPSTPPSLSLH